jgi:hypothetical protein
MRPITQLRALVSWYRALRTMDQILSAQAIRSLSMVALLATATLAASACGSDSDSSIGGNGPDVPEPTGPALTVINHAEHSIWYLKVRDCGTEAWSSDLLGLDVISIGESQSFAVQPGCHDVLLQTDPDYSGQVLWSDVTVVDDTPTEVTLSQWEYAN